MLIDVKGAFQAVQLTCPILCLCLDRLSCPRLSFGHPYVKKGVKVIEACGYPAVSARKLAWKGREGKEMEDVALSENSSLVSRPSFE